MTENWEEITNDKSFKLWITIIDNVFTVNHFVQPGETLGVESFHIFPGGKGQNQSIALAKAGCDVYLAACIGKDGEWVLDGLRENNVNTDLVTVRDCDTGKAVSGEQGRPELYPLL